MEYQIGESKIRLLNEAMASPLVEQNEAATRLHFIDKLLEDCLGWPSNQIDPERCHLGEYSDYELGRPARKVVIEAKREGEYFELPAGLGRRPISLQSLFRASKSLSSAVRQALGYCKDRGIPIGAVCNGHQILIFLGSRLDGIPPDEGKAIAFSSRSEMVNNFRELWDLLSPEGVRANNAARILTDNDFAPPPPKLSNSLISYPGYKNRNPAATDLQILGGLFLEDIAAIPEYREDFVKATYCTSGALSQYALVSKEILSARYNIFFQAEQAISASPARGKRGIDPTLRQDLLAAGLTSRPILLVGDTGVGKSMFIQHLVLVDAKDDLKNAVVLRIDFGVKPSLASDLEAYVREEMERQLVEVYGIDMLENKFVRRVYAKELRRFENGIHGALKETAPDRYAEKETAYLETLLENTEGHLAATISFLVRHNNKQVVVFLDNVDQRSVDFQDRVFLIGQSFAASLPATVFIALRPETFAYSKTKGSLSGYQPRVFTIEPPRVEKVVNRRLEYGLHKLRESGGLPSFPKALHLSSGRLEMFVEMLRDAFSGSEELMEFVDNMSNGNLRTALEFVTSFVGSGHVDSEKIFQILEEQGSYVLPLHEFLRAVIHGDSRYFDPTTSRILNAFDLITDDPREHFLIMALLTCVERLPRDLSTEGFVALEPIYHQLQSVGFNEFAIREALRRCVDRELIAPPRIYTTDDYDRIRINTAGAYTAKRLVGLFTYVDAMIVDTPITKAEFRKRISDVDWIEDRLQRAATFVEYLDSCWARELSQIVDWDQWSASIRGDIEKIAARPRGGRRF